MSKNNNKLIVVFFTLILMTISSLSYAHSDANESMSDSYGDPVEDRTYKKWTVFSRMERKERNKTERFCYMISYPTKISDQSKKISSQPFFAVSRILVKDPRFNKLKASGEINLFTGNTDRKEDKALAKIDQKHNHNLFVKDGYAWTKDVASDTRIIHDMKNGLVLRVYNENKNTFKNKSSLEFSLMGFTKAYRRMFDLCKN